MDIFKRILAVVTGAIVAMVSIGLFEWVGMYMHPMPKGIDPMNKEAMMRLMGQMPVTFFLWLLLSYVVSSFIGGLVASLIIGRRNRVPAMIVGIILTIGGVFNLMEIPHPIWFVVLSTICYIPCAWFGFRTVKRI